MLEKGYKQKKNVFSFFLCFFLLFSALTISARHSHIIFAYNMNNLLRNTTVSEYMQNPDDYYLISREDATGHLRIF